ncbi:MAG: hypothetical protein MUE51_15565, partial [Thermoleophilia bacterium]|nr:hypothetical protein [Thermoleophilia bacterium]
MGAGVVALAALAAAPAALATFPGQNGVIAAQGLIEAGSGASTIVSADTGISLTGTDMGLIFNRDPAWSPDGRRLAMAQGEGASAALAVSVASREQGGQRTFTFTTVPLGRALTVASPA